jgi:caa(3)-type oxidase subunit IV
MTTQAAIPAHEADRSRPNYLAVFIYLAILTAIELGVYAIGLPQVAKVGLLIALAWAQAVLIAMYFMHLAMEKKALAVFAMIPVVLATFLCLMMLPDVTTRMWTKSVHKIGESIPAETGAIPVPPPPLAQPPQH